IANTVTIKSQRASGKSNDGQLRRSAKTAKIYSFGSLNEDTDDDDESDDDDGKMTGDESEIDLDAIEDDDSEDESIKSTDLKVPSRSGNSTKQLLAAKMSAGAGGGGPV